MVNHIYFEPPQDFKFLCFNPSQGTHLTKLILNNNLLCHNDRRPLTYNN